MKANEIQKSFFLLELNFEKKKIIAFIYVLFHSRKSAEPHGGSRFDCSASSEFMHVLRTPFLSNAEIELASKFNFNGALST